MNSQTKVSLTDAADMVGIERTTLYRHIKKKGISVIKEEGSHPKIDVSELIRVYGDKVNPNFSRNKNSNKSDANATKKDDTVVNTTNSDKSLEEKLELLQLERKRERDSLEEQIDYYKKLLEDEKSERRKVTALLTDQSDAKKETTDQWQSLFSQQQENFANQLKTLMEETEKRTEASIKMALEEDRKEQQKKRDELIQKRREAARLKKIEEEKSKGFFKKLFG